MLASMKRIILMVVGVLSIFLITGCTNSGYISNGEYYNENTFYKVKGEDIEYYDLNNYIEAYGTYTESDGIITATYTFRNEIDKSSSEYGNVIPYKRVDILHLEDDKLILDKTSIDGVDTDINKTFIKK